MNKVINRTIWLSIILTLLVVFYWLVSFYHNSTTYNEINFLNIFVLLSYISILKLIMKYGNNINKVPIFALGLFYSIIFGVIYIYIFQNHTGDFFDFQRADTIAYHNYIINNRNLPIIDFLNNLPNTYSWDDFGAFLYGWLLYKLIPNPLFIYFINIIISFFTAISLYKLSKLYLDTKRSLIVSCLFSLSSYLLYINVSLYKEPFFILLCVNAIYKAQQLLNKVTLKKTIHLIVILFLLSLFRIGTPIIILLSYFSYYLLFSSKFNIRNLLILLTLIPIVIFLLYPIFSITYGQFTDAEFLSYYVDQSGYSFSLPIQIAISVFSATFGPVPTFISIKYHEISSFYYSGYLIKYLLSPFFLISIKNIINKKLKYTYPLIIYYLLGSIIFGTALRGFDIRFLITHSFLFYLIVFIGMHDYKTKSIGNKSFLFLSYFLLSIIFFIYNNRF